MPKLILDALTDALIATDRKRSGSRMTDGKGLFLDQPATRAIWRLRYVSPATGKPNNLTLGAWSKAGNNVTAARTWRDEKLALIANGIDPAIVRDEKAEATKAAVEFDNVNKARIAKGEVALHSFKHIADLFIEECSTHQAASTCDSLRSRAGKWVYPHIGSTHIAKVTKAQALLVTQKLQAAGKFDTLGKARGFINDVYDFANTKHIELGLPGDLQTPVVNDKFLFKAKPAMVNRKAVIDGGKFNTEQAQAEQTDRIRKLVATIIDTPEGLDAQPNVGLLVMLLTGQRTDNVAAARKADFDLDAGRWVIPADAMKGSREAKKKGLIADQVVMLASQTVAVLREQFAVYADSEWVFPGKPKGTRSLDNIVLNGKAMNPKAMNRRLWTLGYKDEQTGHGLRAIVRTAGQRLAGCDPVVLEATLAHKAAVKHIEDGGMRGVYSRDIDDGIDPVVHQQEAQKLADWLFGLVRGSQKPALSLVATPASAKLLKAA